MVQYCNCCIFSCMSEMLAVCPESNVSTHITSSKTNWKASIVCALVKRLPVNETLVQFYYNIDSSCLGQTFTGVTWKQMPSILGLKMLWCLRRQGSTERDGERRSSLDSGSTPFPVSYCTEIGLGCGGRAGDDGEGEWGWRVAVALTENMPVTETMTPPAKVIENMWY
jgi:hypothetical protein